MRLVRRLLVPLAALLLSTGCRQKVPAGNVGIKVFLIGSDKGVDMETLPVGRHWVGWNEELYLFPTWEQNPKYAAASGEDEGDSIPFQTKEGMTASADFGVTYHIEANDAAKVFQRYRKGVEEINKGPLRNLLRDAINEVASDMPVEQVYGEKKTEMLLQVQKLLTERAAPAGITVTKVSLLGSIQLPAQIMDSVNAKLQASQKSQQRENEVATAKAQADIDEAKAKGEARAVVAQADGEAHSITARADAQAAANRKIAASLSPELVEYEKAKRWDGKLPQFTGAATPFISFNK